MTDDDDQLLDRLGQALSAPVPRIDPARARRLTVQAQEARSPRTTGDPSRRRVLWWGVAAAGGVAAGATGVALLGGDDTPAGPPTEAVADLTMPAGVEAEARIIAHEWGMEVMLDVSGLRPGTPYSMTFIGPGDAPVSAGGFLGTDGLMRCRNNAAVLRADVTRIEVADDAGVIVVRGDLA